MVVINRKTLGTVCLAIATFLNPFGFDILVYKLNELTQDYWSTMHLLYASAALCFGLSYLFFKKNKKAIGNFLLTLGLFLNPLGFDLVVYGINSITNSYWMTMSVMYGLTAVFFGLFIYLYNINPIKVFRNHAIKMHNKVKKKISK